MLKKFEIVLDGPGIILFDPYLLAEFVQQYQLGDTNLFQQFKQNTQVGDEAVRQGVILPIYTIPAIEYQIVISDSSESSVEADWVRFTTSPFPLTIGNGKLVVSDIYGIMDWDAEFYKIMAVDVSECPQVATELESGKYSVVIKGFSERNYVGRGPKNIGYKFLLQKVEELPVLQESMNNESFDFVLYRPGQPG